MPHKQDTIPNGTQEVFKVNIELQSLMQLFWDKELEIFNCSKDRVDGTVCFEYELSSWMKIVDAAFQYSSRELFYFIENECEVEILFGDDGRPDENDGCWIEDDTLLWSAAVRFPREHLGTFEWLLRDTLGMDD